MKHNTIPLMIVTSIIGTIISFYLLYVHYFPLVPDKALYALCTAGDIFDCNAVNTSSYAVLFGFPLSAWSIALYLFFISVLILYIKKTRNVIAEFIMLWLAIVAVLLSVVLGYISFVKIKKICSFCMILWICNGALLVLLLIYIKSIYTGIIKGINCIHDFDVASVLGTRAVQKQLIAYAIAGIIALGVALAANESLQYAYAMKEKQRETALIDEFKKEYDSFPKVTIDRDDIEPLIGKKEYPVHITVFFDFNCGACHRAVKVLSDLAQKYEHSIALYIRHFPLDALCNRFVKRKKDGSSCHASVMAYAMYGREHYYDFIMQLMEHRGKVDSAVISDVLSGLQEDYTHIQELSHTQKVKKMLEQDIALGGKLGINATPTIIINDTKLKSGIPPAYILEMAIKIEMEKVRK